MYMHIYLHIFMQKYIHVNNMGMHTVGMLQSQTRISTQFHAAWGSSWIGSLLLASVSCNKSSKSKANNYLETFTPKNIRSNFMQN